MAGSGAGGRCPRHRAARGAPSGPALAGRPSGAARGARRSRTATPPASRGEPPPRPGRSSAAPARRPSASSASIASSWRPAAATDRWRLALSALRTRLRSPRRLRATLRASSSRSDALAADAAQERGDRLRALPGHDTGCPRRMRQDGGQPDVAQAGREHRRLVGGTTNSRWARPAERLSDPRARNRPRSQASPAVLGRRRPVQVGLGQQERPAGRLPHPRARDRRGG